MYVYVATCDAFKLSVCIILGYSFKPSVMQALTLSLNLKALKTPQNTQFKMHYVHALHCQ